MFDPRSCSNDHMKYDRIDPAEVQALKDEISSLNVTVKDLQQQKTDLEQADSNKDVLLSQKNARVRRQVDDPATSHD